MKHLLSTLFILSSIVLSAQDVTGVYQKKKDTDEFSSIRKLTLKEDGTFEFYHIRFIENGIPKETLSYGKGTWTLENKVITFSTETSDLDSKYTLNFNNSKARYNTKSLRDKTNRVFADFIIFYKTDVVLAQRLKLFKDSTL